MHTAGLDLGWLDLSPLDITVQMVCLPPCSRLPCSPLMRAYAGCCAAALAACSYQCLSPPVCMRPDVPVSSRCACVWALEGGSWRRDTQQRHSTQCNAPRRGTAPPQKARMAAHGTAHASGSRCMAALSAGHVGAGGLYPEGKGRGVEQRGARFISRRFLLLARHPNPEMLRPQALNPQPLNPSP